ncbi:MAG TPA: hypothetical protein DDY65_04755 [Ruminococcaceae bacterium]|jgi:hypothetical protein|nr:hypothetical protein [Oscillospiraceae bacterium]
MWIECAAIAGIFLLMSVIFLRRRRIQWLWATLPLTLVPLAYFVTYAVVGIVLKVTINDIAGVVVLISAVAISCVWLGLVSNGFTDRKTRVTYISIANSFNVALAIILSVDILTH